MVMDPSNGSTMRGETRRDDGAFGLPTKNTPCVISPTRRRKVRRDIVMRCGAFVMGETAKVLLSQ